MTDSKAFKFTILHKMYVLVLVIVTIFACAMLMMRSANNTVADRFTEFNEQDFQVFLKFGRVKEVQVDTMLNIRGLQISYLLNLNEQSQGYQSIIKSNHKITPNLLASLKKSTSAANMARFLQFDTLVNDFQEKAVTFVAAMNEAPDNKAPFSVFKAFVDSYDALTTFFDDYEIYLNESTQQTQLEIGSAIEQAELVFWLGLVVAFVISLVLSQLIASGINRGIQTLKSTAQKLSEGNLVTKAAVTSKDELGELGDALNSTIERLRTIISTINHSSDIVAKNSDEVMHYNGDVKANSDEVTDNTNQAVTAIEQMSVTSQSIAENITNTASSAEEIDQVAIQSLQISNQSVNEIETLLASFTSTVNTVEDLKAQTDSINKILDVIKAISEQTNLLALNAAIEAARAGEQGRGFAVVADEVRQLAQRSQNSVNEIETMLTSLVAAGDTASEQMTKSNQIANNLNERIEASNGLMREIQEKVSAVSLQSQEIASAAEEQSVVAQEISNNMHTIKSVVERNADTINTSNSKSEEMKASANQVSQQLAVFQLT
ncbi:methyl-accepting chemotaxis protein [Thalassotalea agariperforans]